MTDKTSIHWVREARDKLANARSFDAIAAIVNGTEKQVECYREDDGYAEECERDAAEIRLRAKRRIGELLASQERHKPALRSAKAPRSAYTTAVEITGIHPSTARDYQRLAKIPQEEFDARIEARRAEGRTVSAAMFDNVAEQSREESEDRKALASVVAKIATLATLDFAKIVAYSDPHELDNYVRQMEIGIQTLETAIGTIQATRRTHRLELVV